MRPKIEEHIAEKISSFEEGMIFFIDDFLDFGSSESVKKALYRLETKDKIKRLSHGIYYKPKFSKIVGELLPSVEEVAQAIARRDKARIIPTGVYAENILGLTTQVPMKLVFLIRSCICQMILKSWFWKWGKITWGIFIFYLLSLSQK